MCKTWHDGKVGERTGQFDTGKLHFSSVADSILLFNICMYNGKPSSAVLHLRTTHGYSVTLKTQHVAEVFIRV